jgi:spermidine/putrescine transport system permease protein
LAQGFQRLGAQRSVENVVPTQESGTCPCIGHGKTCLTAAEAQNLKLPAIECKACHGIDEPVHERVVGSYITIQHPNTAGLAAITALTTTLLGFIFSFMARIRAGAWAETLLFIVLVTLFGGYLMKIYAWKTILGNEGLLNTALIGLGIISKPITTLLYSPGAVVVTLVHFSLPFAVLPIYAAMRAISDTELEAARDLGAGPWSPRTLTNFPMNGISLRWWHEMSNLRQFWSAFSNSLVIGSCVAIVSSVAGTLAAIGLAAMPKRHASVIINLLTLPVALPPLVLGVALLSFYVGVQMRLGLPTVILSHVLFAQPFVILIVYARMETFDRRLIESARDLGAGPLRAFFTVALPIISPIVIGAALIAMALSIDDFVITFFTIGTGNTLPTLVWGMIRTGLTPAVNAMGTLILLLTISSTIIALRLTKYRG